MRIAIIQATQHQMLRGTHFKEKARLANAQLKFIESCC